MAPALLEVRFSFSSGGVRSLSQISMRFGGWDRVAVFGCGFQLIPQPWDYSPPLPVPYATLCTYEPALGSWATCVQQVITENSPENEHTRWLHDSTRYVNLVCQKAGGNLAQFTVDEWQAALKNASSYLLPAPDLQDLPMQKLVNPVVLEDAPRKRIIRGVHAEFINLDASNDCALWPYYYFAALLLFLMVIAPRINGWHWFSKFRGRFTIPTIWRSPLHSQHSSWAMGGLWPDSQEACILTTFLAVHTAALLCNYTVDHEEIMEPVLSQIMQALGNRTGIISFGLLPLLVAFTTRSAVLMRLTGWRYTTFIVLHRWIGRTVIFDAIVHSIAFYYHERMTGELGLATQQYWWIAGIVATVLSCVILVMGSGFFRRRWYETFLYTHIAMAIAFFYECWKHVEIFGWLNWLKVSIILWVFERIWRFVLICRHGVLESRAVLLNDEILTLNVAKPSTWNMKPGQYAFVYFLFPSTFWQSHPFTVTDTGNTLKLVITVKSGATKALCYAMRNRSENDGTLNVPMLLEGPYGVSPDLKRFNRLLIVCGGSGVPGPFALALDAARKTPTQAINLVIVGRDWTIFEAYREQIEALIESNVVLHVHYTHSNAEVGRPAWLQRVQQGRPDIYSLVFAIVQDTKSFGVVCCGPPGLNDSTRNFVAKATEEFPRVDVEYFEEYQVW